jgi:hypothetical protein
MPGRDDEAPRVDAHGLVLGAAKRDEPIAAELTAFAAKRDTPSRRIASMPSLILRSVA